MNDFLSVEELDKKLKAAFVGDSGSGKTISSVRLADALRRLDPNPEQFYIAVIDTEAGAIKNAYQHCNVDSSYFKVKMIPDNEFSYSLMKSSVEAAINAGFKCVIVDSISPGWIGESGIYGNAVKGKGGKLTGNDHMQISMANDKVLSWITNVDIPFICTIKEKEVVDFSTFTKTKKIVQKKGFEFNFDIIANTQRKGFSSPVINNGALFSQDHLSEMAQDANMSEYQFLLKYKVKEIPHVVSMSKSRMKAFAQGEVIQFSKLDFLKFYVELHSLTLANEVLEVALNNDANKALELLNNESLSDFDKRAIKYVFDF